MRLYYFCKFVKQSGIWFNQFALSHPGVDFIGTEVATGPDGAPSQKGALIMVGATDHRPFQNSPGIVPLPDMTLDGKISNINAPNKLRCISRLKSEIGFTDAEVDAVWGNGADSYEGLLDHYGKLNAPSFSSKNLDLTDL
jgi:hypothetical protein